MKFDMVVAGVGGQGILSISFVVDNAALEQGLSFKQSEVHGMAQRGGAVVSHLRIADGEVFSDLIPKGGADLVLSMEPLEALRYRDYLAKGGALITSSTPFVNIPDYPGEDEILSGVWRMENHTLVNAAELARAAGSGFAQNMVMLGAAGHLLPIEQKHLEKFIGVLFRAKGEKVIETNLAAFRFGAQSGRFYRDLLEAGLEPSAASALATRLEPWDYGQEDVEGWVELLGLDSSGGLKSWLRSRSGLFRGDSDVRARMASLDLNSAGGDDFEAAVAG